MREIVTIKVHLSIGLVADVNDTIEVEDGSTDEQIETEVREWALERAEWSWNR